MDADGRRHLPRYDLHDVLYPHRHACRLLAVYGRSEGEARKRRGDDEGVIIRAVRFRADGQCVNEVGVSSQGR